MTASVSWPLNQVDPASVGFCPQRLSRVGDLLRTAVDAGTVAGAITLAARRGGIAHLACCGLADLESRRPMREDAIFRIYSMTKLVTTVAALMLMEDGKFVLHEPVARFIPSFEKLRVAVKQPDGAEALAPLARPITIRDLMTHMSGIDYELFRTAQMENTLDLAGFVEALCQQPLKAQPGRQWIYGASTDVLGRLVEVVSGLPLDEFFQQRIFKPLGMTDSGFYCPPEKLDRLTGIYRPDPDAPAPQWQPTRGAAARPESRLIPGNLPAGMRFTEKPRLFSGGGGLLSTTCDYLRFALMLLNRGQFGDTRLLGRKTIELMTDDHLPPGHAPIDVNGRTFAMGLGVSIYRRPGEAHEVSSPGEFGWGGAAGTQVWIDPHEDMVTMFMVQYQPRAKMLLTDMAKQAMYQALI